MTENICTLQGCCVPSEHLTLPNRNGDDNPDKIPPNIFLEILKAILFAPYAFALFFYGVARHCIYKPKRPTWDLQTMINIESTQIARTLLKWNHVYFWRAILKVISFKRLSDSRDASFKVPKGTHPGIFQVLSEEEDGTKVLKADWLLCKNPANKEKIVYYIPGGAFVFYDKRCYNALTLSLRENLQRQVFAVRYRLAPESRFPGPIFDVFKGYFHLINDLKFDPKNITFIGDSAGGNICLATMFYLREHGYPLPGACITLSPWIDMSYSYPSWLEYGKFDYLPERPIFDSPTVNPSRCYLGRENHYALTQHPYASLQYMDNFENMPPILIQAGGCEVLVDEIRAFASKLEHSKTTRVTYEEYEDMYHVFQSFPIKKAGQAYESMKIWLEREESSKE